MNLLPSSFRDPSGFVFSHDHTIYRQVNNTFSGNYDRFMSSGLYEALVSKGLLVAHEDVTDSDLPRTDSCHRIIRPTHLPFISYPYEWSYSQLKDAAILTLRIQARALKFGFVLKDASAYNIQFVDSRPLFIDTLSFEPYEEGTPWVAYRQFCQHFLAPLALMATVDIDLGKLLITHIDGIPLPLASKLLPWSTKLKYGIQAHIHLHARVQTDYADSAGTDQNAGNRAQKARNAKLSTTGLKAIIESLASTIDKLKWKPAQTEWGDYYSHTNYSDQATLKKRELVDSFLSAIDTPLATIHDLGANTGEFSRIAANHGSLIISQDIDPVAVERNYRECRGSETKNILPLVQNLFAPSPSIGWANEERESFRQRANCDAILALALVHHLAISNNTPLSHIASLFSSLGNWLIIEFVPKSDSQVVRLLETREDVFPDYTEQGFEKAFSVYFSIVKKASVSGTERSLYLMASLNSAEPSTLQSTGP
ncbi:MAG: hypothetical protein V7700_17460 [Halioglobus sp.]